MNSVDLSQVVKRQKKALEDERRRRSNRLASSLHQIARKGKSSQA